MTTTQKIKALIDRQDRRRKEQQLRRETIEKYKAPIFGTQINYRR